jgi:hypothetical protein
MIVSGMFLRASGGAKSRQEKAFRDLINLRPDETRQNRCRLVPVRRNAAEFYPYSTLSNRRGFSQPEAS